MSETIKFENYADTHPMGGPVSDFERVVYQRYVQEVKGLTLDIGCGDGKYLHFFRSINPGINVVGCDISLKRIQRISANGFSGVVGSAFSLPYKNESFELVFLMQVIEHVADPDRVVRECRRVLKKGGTCFMLTPNYPAKRIYDWIEMLRHRKWNKFFDDPTHCSRFSARRLSRLIAHHFNRVEILPTFVLGEKFKTVKKWKENKKSVMVFTHKLLAVCS